MEIGWKLLFIWLCTSYKLYITSSVCKTGLTCLTCLVHSDIYVYPSYY